MSKVRADNISNRADDGAPALTYGAEIPVGVAITGAGNINIGGNVSVGGTLTYEDVTNIDSVGIVTARSGVLVGSGQSYGSTDGATAVYYGDGSNLTGIESWNQFDTWLYGGG
jgi:hypothetical protein